MPDNHPRFRRIDGRHPLRDAAPGAFVDYRARPRRDARVAYLNFALAREMGLLPARHPDQLTKSLERAVLECFALVIVNEYDLAHGPPIPECELLPHPFMATRYLQLQHPDRQGLNSGDGRSIWNGSFTHRGVTWDLSSCGTGVTRLCPATSLEGRFFQTGNDDADYGCGTAALAEGLGAAIMSNVFHRNGIATERVLAVIETPHGQAINVRASRCLLRPSHLFAPLHQGDSERLRGLTDFFIERQIGNGEWPALPGRGARRYGFFAEEMARTFARLAATFEREYIFCWLDWDGDNILMNGGIIDYGSVRQFGLYHRSYRFQDGERMSTSIPEQRRKARDVVRKFCQIRDLLTTGEKPALESLDDDPVMALFDRCFEETRKLLLLHKMGFAPELADLLIEREPETIARFDEAFGYFERARAARGPVRVADGFSWNAIFCVRDLLRELPKRYLERDELVAPAEFIAIAASSYASRRDRKRFPHRVRKVREFQRHYRALARAAAAHSGRSEAAVLSEMAVRACVIDRSDRMTGDGIDVARSRLQRERSALTPDGVYQLVERFAEAQSLDPAEDGPASRPRSRRGERVLAGMLDLIHEYREGL